MGGGGRGCLQREGGLQVPRPGRNRALQAGNCEAGEGSGGLDSIPETLNGLRREGWPVRATRGGRCAVAPRRKDQKEFNQKLTRTLHPEAKPSGLGRRDSPRRRRGLGISRPAATPGVAGAGLCAEMLGLAQQRPKVADPE